MRGDPAGAEQPILDDSSWQRVTLPHTYNAHDDLPGPKMYQGPAWYRKSFTAPADWGGRRVFLRFGAASLVADVYLNGESIGEHRGGFQAFCFEITGRLHLGARNEVAVRVNNKRGIVSPLAGDFTIYGGLYRTAELIVTGPICISPTDFASPGVYLKQKNVTRQAADVDVSTVVSNSSDSERPIRFQVKVFDAHRKEILQREAMQNVGAHETKWITQLITLDNPHLWNGVVDPYVYTARVELFDGERRIDAVEQPLGLRFFTQGPLKGFTLNGTPMQIHGVCRHQDWAGTGWAIDEKQQDVNMRLMREMGVNGVRLAHYQHNPYFYSLCDKNGVIAWAELAIVNNVRNTPEFEDNVRQQLTELIKQNYNHPAILMWSMYNEVGSRGPGKPGPIIKDLSELAHSLDPTRFTTGAASGDTMANLPDVMQAVDLISLNLYNGWYGGKPSDLGPTIDRYNKRYGSKGVSVSEYGAGASIHQHEQGMTHSPSAGGHFHPEEWQAIFHEVTYAAIKARSYVWGSFVWNMFDFTSASRKEGDMDGINDKGLVTRDRKVRKDAFYFYKASWTDAPMVYITSRRDDHRTAAQTAVKIYSNCSEVSLTVNGQSLGKVPMTADHVFVVDGVLLNEGWNTIEATATQAGRTVHDSCRWQFTPE